MNERKKKLTDQLKIAKKFCLLYPCEIAKDIATGRCYACKIGSSLKNAYLSESED